MVIYEENTKRIVIPSGLGNLTGLMEAEAQAMYNSGHTDGYNEGVEDGKSMQDRKLTDSVTFNENGEYDADYGYKKVIVDVDKQWDEGFEVGYESGFTDGYASGYTNGYASGYTDGQAGYELGTFVNTPMPNDLYGTIYTKSFNDEPHSPEIVGWGALHMDLGQIIYYGKNEQKALMTSGTIVSNGTYTMEDGWNKIVVDVPQGESKGPLYSIFVSFAGHPTLSSLPTDWKVNGFDFTVTSGYTNISTYTLIGVDGYLDSAVSLITPTVTVISFKVPTTDYEQWSEFVSASNCRVNGTITYQTSAYNGGFLQHITGWAGTPDADDPSKTIITINIG